MTMTTAEAKLKFAIDTAQPALTAAVDAAMLIESYPLAFRRDRQLRPLKFGLLLHRAREPIAAAGFRQIAAAITRG
jgi:hypothetical protein